MEKVKKFRWTITATALVAIIIVLVSCASSKIPPQLVVITPTISNSPSPLVDQKSVEEPSTFAASSAISKEKSIIIEEENDHVTKQVSPDSNVPPIPGANLFISVVDEQGQMVEVGTIEVSVEYQDFPDRNYAYSVDLSLVQDSLLALYPPPSHIPATVSLQVVTPDSRTSDTLIIKNDEYWNAVSVSGRDFVASHEFNLGRSGIVTNLVYN